MECGERQSWHEAAQDLRTKLSRYAAKPRFNSEFEKAFVFFFGEGPDEMQDVLEPQAFGRFMEWFVHDYRLSHGHRLIELFGMEYATSLSCRKRHLLEAWQESRMTLLQIEAIDRGTIKVRDLLLGGEYVILPPAPVNVQGIPAVGRLLVGRLLRVGELWEMPYGVTVLPSSYRERLLQILRGEYRRYKKNRGGDWNEFLQEQGFVFNDLIESIGDDIRSGGEIRYRWRAFFDVTDKSIGVENMRDAVGNELACRWLKDLEGVSKERTWPDMPGSLRVDKDRLTITCFSAEEIDAAKRIVASRLGHAVRHRLDVIERCEDSGIEPGSWLRPALVGRHGETWPERRFEAAAAWNGIGGDDGSTDSEERELLASVPMIPAALSKPEYPTERQAQVADLFCSVLKMTGASEAHIDSAMWLWSDFCRVRSPRIRKVAVWAAAVHVVLGRIEGWRFRASTLAELYGVTSASVNRNAAMITDELDVKQFDDRYCVEHPVDGLLTRLRAVTERDMSADAEELIVEGFSVLRAEVAERLLALRNVVVTSSQELEQLSDRAHEYFLRQVGCSAEDPFWYGCFVDWFHFDWKIPVRGGRTVLEEVLASGDLSPFDAQQLQGWRNCHPMYYVVDAASFVSSEDSELTDELVLRVLGTQEDVTVFWPLAFGALRRGDLLLARVVPLDDMRTVVAPVLHFHASIAPRVKKRLDEERALLEHWNGRRMSWRDISARYAERLYAIAYRATRGFPDEL
ncbi:MAG: hypothetical protein GX162_00565 [Firmicutes bacterium]|nr:hypothetical protein [Bacillota bacterium]